MGRFTGILGLLTMLGLAFAFSTNRRAIRIKTVAWGLGLQVAFAIFVLRAEVGRIIFQKAGDAVNRLLSYSFAGSQFVFGELGKPGSHLGFYFAFQVLPLLMRLFSRQFGSRSIRPRAISAGVCFSTWDLPQPLIPYDRIYQQRREPPGGAPPAAR